MEDGFTDTLYLHLTGAFACMICLQCMRIPNVPFAFRNASLIDVDLIVQLMAMSAT